MLRPGQSCFAHVEWCLRTGFIAWIQNEPTNVRLSTTYARGLNPRSDPAVALQSAKSQRQKKRWMPTPRRWRAERRSSRICRQRLSLSPNSKPISEQQQQCGASALYTVAGPDPLSTKQADSFTPGRSEGFNPTNKTIHILNQEGRKGRQGERKVVPMATFGCAVFCQLAGDVPQVNIDPVRLASSLPKHNPSEDFPPFGHFSLQNRQSLPTMAMTNLTNSAGPNKKKVLPEGHFLFTSCVFQACLLWMQTSWLGSRFMMHTQRVRR